jgi:hypothetical protein
MFAPLIARPQAKKATGAAKSGDPQSSGLVRRASSIIPAVLSSQGQELPSPLQASVGRALDFNFSNVRVHDDSAAHASASALGARAWTYGEHVILGAHASPQTLVHELAHVVHQQGAPFEDTLRVGAPGDAMEQEANLASRTLMPPRLRAPSQMIQMQSEGESGQFQLREPKLGQRSARPYPSFAPGHVEFQLLPEDKQRINAYLSGHRFHLERLSPVLDGTVVTMDQIVERLRPLLLPVIGRDKIEAYVEAKVRALALDAIIHPKLTSEPSVPRQLTLRLPEQPTKHRETKPIKGWQKVVGAGGQIAWHVNLATGRPATTPEDVTMQFQAGATFAGHPDKESGSELSGLVQFGYNVTNHQTTIMSGAQFTEVFALFNDLLELSGFAQVLTGVAVGGGSISAQIQPAVGVQAIVNIGPLQLGAQIFRGATITPGGESTRDTGGAVIFQYNF